MTSDSRSEFEARLERIRWMRDDASSELQAQKLRRKARSRWTAALRATGFVALSVVLLKSAIIFGIGHKTYTENYQALATGNTIDRMSARLMQPDMLTQTVAGAMGTTINGVAAAGEIVAQAGATIAALPMLGTGSEPTSTAAADPAPAGGGLFGGLGAAPAKQADNVPFMVSTGHQRGGAAVFIAALPANGEQLQAGLKTAQATLSKGATSFMAAVVPPASAATVPPAGASAAAIKILRLRRK
jgi:hypothetical protein